MGTKGHQADLLVLARLQGSCYLSLSDSVRALAAALAAALRSSDSYDESVRILLR